MSFSQHQDVSWYSPHPMPKATEKLFKICTEPSVILSDRLRHCTTAEARLNLTTKSSNMPLFSPYTQRRIPLYYSARNYHPYPHVNYFSPLFFKTEIISREITCFGSSQKSIHCYLSSILLTQIIENNLGIPVIDSKNQKHDKQISVTVLESPC